MLSKFGLKKSDRILDRAEFITLSRYGNKLQDQYLVVLFMPTDGAHSRLGITVSKRVGNAVVRNRLKRLIREWFRINRVSITGNWDINVIAKKQAAGAASHRIFMSLEKLSAKIEGFRH